MKRGFTLIEVLLAIVLLGVGVIPLLGGLARSSISSVRNEREMRTVFLAQQLVENVKSQAVNNFSGDYSQGPTRFSGPDQGFKYTIDYYVSDGDDADKIRSIHVTVWYDGDDDDVVDTEEEQMELFAKIAKRA